MMQETHGDVGGKMRDGDADRWEVGVLVERKARLCFIRRTARRFPNRAGL
jgi:hypothetical protein